MMWPYFVMVGVPGFIALLGFKLDNDRLRNRLVIVSFFLIWFTLLCFRSERVGIDTVNYHYMFIKASQMSFGDIFSKIFDSQFEIGFYTISRIVSFFTMEFRVVMVICAMISLIPIAVLYYFRAEHYAYLSIVIFLALGLFSIYFSAMRQVMALSFVVPVYYFTKNRKLVFFLLICVFAILFHHSAIVLLLMYPVYHMNLRLNKNLLLLIPVIILVYIFRVPIFKFLSGFLSEFYSGDIKETGAILIFVLLCILLIFSFVIPNNALLDKDTIGLRNILFLCMVLQVFSGINYVAMRMNYYYLVFVPLLIPRIFKYTSEKNKKIASIAFVFMVGFFTVWYFYRAYTSQDILHVYPYYPAWAK